MLAGVVEMGCCVILGTLCYKKARRSAGTSRGVRHTFLRAAQMSPKTALNHLSAKELRRIQGRFWEGPKCSKMILSRP